MSSGSRIELYVAIEESMGVLPASPDWFIVPRVTDGLSENVTTTTSEIVSASRFRQGATAIQSEVTGDLASELSVGTFDLFMTALAMNDWDDDQLEFGGALRKSFTFIKVFSDVGIIRKYSGVMFGSGTFSISNGEKITVNFGLTGSGYEELTVNPVSDPQPLMTTPLVSSLNVKDFELDGQGVVGTACLQSVELEINNNLEAIYCIGNGKMTAEKYIEKMVDINLTTQFMFSGQVAEYSGKIKTGDTTSISFAIEDAEGNGYLFDFPLLQVTEAPHPDAGGDDLVTQDITFAHIETSPTITRYQAVAVDSISVSPSTASLEVGETQQLTVAFTPSDASNKTVTYSTSDSGVASVSGTGLVTAIGEGTATITATSVDGGKTSTSTITVTEP